MELIRLNQLSSYRLSILKQSWILLEWPCDLPENLFISAWFWLQNGRLFLLNSWSTSMWKYFFSFNAKRILNLLKMIESHWLFVTSIISSIWFAISCFDFISCLAYLQSLSLWYALPSNLQQLLSTVFNMGLAFWLFTNEIH